MAMAPFNLSLLGVETLHRRRMADSNADKSVLPDTTANATHEQNVETDSAPATTTTTTAAESTPRHHHRSRPRPRFTSQYNTFQTSCSVSDDAPPKYATAARTRPNLSGSRLEGSESLPGYTCTVAAEGKFLLSYESLSPLVTPRANEWREAYVVLTGTMMSIYRLKDGGAGKLIQSYTLQHAEIGLATDTEHITLVPQTRLAHLIPSAAKRRAWQKDPDLFKAVKQTVLRLRLETDQFVLADSDEERVHSFIQAISAGIDIAQPIDERSVPKQCTVPRRRRRQQRPPFNGDLADPNLLAEQERIFRQMFPRFAETIPGVQTELHTISSVAQSESPSTPAREEEEIDFSMIREETNISVNAQRPQTSSEEPARPTISRSITTTTVESTYEEDMMYATPMSNFTADGKWQPPHTRSPAQVQRYIKKCMPVLIIDADRASNILINHGQRMKISYRKEILEEWELQPPSYKAHEFEKETSLARANSQRSATGSANSAAPRSSNSMIAMDYDTIEQAEQGLESLQLSKVMSVGDATTPKGDPSEATLHAMAQLDPKGRSPQQLAQDIHGVVFCF